MDSDDKHPDQGDYKVFMYRLDKLEEGQKNLETGQNQILAELRQMPRCPSPGLCTSLQFEFKAIKEAFPDLDKRLRALEGDRNRAQGAGWAIWVVWTVLGFLLSGGVVALIKVVFQ